MRLRPQKLASILKICSSVVVSNSQLPLQHIFLSPGMAIGSDGKTVRAVRFEECDVYGLVDPKMLITALGFIKDKEINVVQEGTTLLIQGEKVKQTFSMLVADEFPSEIKELVESIWKTSEEEWLDLPTTKTLSFESALKTASQFVSGTKGQWELSHVRITPTSIEATDTFRMLMLEANGTMDAFISARGIELLTQIVVGKYLMREENIVFRTKDQNSILVIGRPQKFLWPDFKLFLSGYEGNFVGTWDCPSAVAMLKMLSVFVPKDNPIIHLELGIEPGVASGKTESGVASAFDSIPLASGSGNMRIKLCPEHLIPAAEICENLYSTRTGNLILHSDGFGATCLISQMTEKKAEEDPPVTKEERADLPF